jgi:hypothetical protein
MSYSRDKRIADEAAPANPPGCRAAGCPLPWSTDFGGAPLCTYHGRCSSAHEWPRVTQQLLDIETERALNGPRSPKPQRYATRADGVAALQKLRQMGRGDPKLWARRLQWREENGRTLTRFQREAWRIALGVSLPASPSVYGLLMPEEATQ